MDLDIPSGAAEALYRTMVRIRAFENAAETASQGGVSAYGQQAGGAAKVRGRGSGCAIARRLRASGRRHTASPGTGGCGESNRTRR